MTIESLQDQRVQFSEQFGKVSDLRIDWTPTQWVDTLNREGVWLDNSLASAHAIRCILTVALYDDGWISSDNFVQLVGALRIHRDELFESGLSLIDYEQRRLQAVDPETDNPDEQNPFIRLADMWHAAKDLLAVSPPTDFAAPEDFDSCVRLLNDGLSRISKCDLKPRSGAGETQRQLLLSRLLPALRVVSERLYEAAPREVEGLAVVDKETRIPLRTQAGLAIFGDQQQIDEMLPMWRREDRNIDKRISVVPVTLSERGLKIHAA
jgi:hypothetical protein